MKVLSIGLNLLMALLFLFIGEFNHPLMLGLLAIHVLILIRFFKPYKLLSPVYTTMWVLIYTYYNFGEINASFTTMANGQVGVSTLQILFLIGAFIFVLMFFAPEKGYFILGSLVGFWVSLVYSLIFLNPKGPSPQFSLDLLNLKTIEHVYSNLWWLTLVFASLFYLANFFNEEDVEEKAENTIKPMRKIKKRPLPKVNEAKLKTSLEELNNLVGLHKVKEFVTELANDTAIHRERLKKGQIISNMSYHMIFTGPPGTGKTTVARIVGDVLNALGVVSKGHLVEVTREDLVGEYVGQTAPKTRKMIEEARGGILFIDEAYSLARANDSRDYGLEAIDTLVKCIEEFREELVVILAGYPKEMNVFLNSNSGLSSRFALKIDFPEYTNEELLEIGKRMLEKQEFAYTDKIQKALSYAIHQRNIKGDENSGNGRLIRNIIEDAIRKQSRRLKEIGSGDIHTLISEDFGFNQEHFNIDDELKKVIGHEELKELVQKFIAQVRIQKMRHEKGLKYNLNQSYHMIFKGNPGTGKTMMARIMANVLKELKVLKKGQLVEVDRSDLVSAGFTAERTKEKIKEALGGILFIDEAYSLSRDMAGLEAIDTLVKAMEDYRENLVVILAGYDAEMQKFLETNPGLASRFPNIFPFKDYNEQESMQIFEQLLTESDYKISNEVKQEFVFPLICNGIKTNEGNGRFVRNLFEAAQRNQAIRLHGQKEIKDEDLITLMGEDFLPLLKVQNSL
jgi:SpoVK/Ycf46/Vps4 family AAA+-type ATPase